jgi:hypothetical protein
VGYDDADPAPSIGEIRSPPLEPTGFSDIVRPDQDGHPTVIRVKNGKCYSADEEMRYLGTKEQFFPSQPSEEEMDKIIKEVRESQMKQFNK